MAPPSGMPTTVNGNIIIWCITVVKNGCLLSLMMEVRSFPERKGVDLVTGLKESTGAFGKTHDEGKQ